jgi:hypothetical protein
VLRQQVEQDAGDWHRELIGKDREEEDGIGREKKIVIQVPISRQSSGDTV